MKKNNYKFVSKNRRPVENRRFVTGHGNFIADIDRPGMLHVAILASHEPSAKINKIDSVSISDFITKNSIHLSVMSSNRLK